ncbi:hypothetical protein K9M78_02755 [Candidatus Bipolaricaulota bacterium]|nr:hypothetical protein [Candidatus Bipolaricaulota bacterium]
MDPQVYAVLTGDVVNSGALEGYGESLDYAFNEFEGDYQKKLPLKVDRYAGDRFQVLYSDPVTSLRGSLYLITKLASMEPQVQVRISIGIGKIDVLPQERVSTGEGEAFRLSGRNLNKMKKHQRITLEVSDEIPKRNVNNLLRGTTYLLSALLMNLSSTQAEVICYKLRDYTQEEIAKETDRTQQTVSDILIAGYWRNLESFLKVFEKEFSEG